MENIKCKDCEFLTKYKNENYTKSSLHLRHARCQFYCSHPKVNEVKNIIAPNVYKYASFVGYDDGFSYKLETLKTRLKWCPLANKEVLK